MGARGAMAVQSANMERAKHCVPFAAAGVSVSMKSSDADAERAAHPQNPGDWEEIRRARNLSATTKLKLHQSLPVNSTLNLLQRKQ
jgi:hypothetical protein